MQDFAVGQRWLSDTEAELGLGIVIDVEERTVSILFPTSDETRVYARNNAPLSRLIFVTGDEITDQDGEKWLVVSVEIQQKLVRYHVVDKTKPDSADKKVITEARLGAHLQLAKPLEKLLAGRVDSKDWYDIRIEALLMHAKMDTSPLRGLIGPRVGIVPHQFYIAHEVGRRLAPRVLLADEVGLGKTIEAGLIIHQQLVTGRSERILILVPDSLQYQWMIEMRRRFNLSFSLYDLVRTASIKEHDPEANPFLADQCIIASIDLLLDHEDLREQALAAGFDLLVVDEAHHLTWNEDNGGNPQYDMVEEFAKKTAGVLLLTATPEQLGLESHFARLRLLDAQRFDSLDAFIEEEAGYTQTAHIAQALMTDEVLPADMLQAIENVLGQPIDDTPDNRQRAMNELLDRHGTGRILFRNTRDAIQGFPGRFCLPMPLPQPENWPVSGKLRNQMWPEELQLDGDWMQTDPRVPWLLELLRKNLKHKKVLLIARSGPVVAALDMALRIHGGIRSTVFNEDMTLLERDQAAAYFADSDNGAQILLCSEIGSEGRNFQFASDLVLFDLPANPDVLEQRIGRLDRIGQANTIQIHVPYIANTAQERMFRWYNEALDIFNHISPTAQSLHENHLPVLKDALLTDTGEVFEQLLSNVAQERLVLEAQLQSGRDRLLEYNSCRPNVAARIVHALEEHDTQTYILDFLSRFMAATNIEYDEQRDGSIIIRPTDEMLVDGLDIDEEGMTAIFNREQALSRDDAQYITIEHPLMRSVFEVVETQPFGNTNVCVLRSGALPPGSILLEAWFRVHVVAPRGLNLRASLPQQLIRVLMSEKGQDLSAKVSSVMLSPHMSPIDTNNARQVTKARREQIEVMYQKAEKSIHSQLDEFSNIAQKRFADKISKEISRLEYLKAHNPSIRDDELLLLNKHKDQGIALLQNLSAIPDSIRIMVVMKP